MSMQSDDRAIFETLFKAAKKGDAGLLREYQTTRTSDLRRVVNLRHPRRGLTLLMVACQLKETGKTWRCGTAADIVSILLSVGADTTLRDTRRKYGYTALHYAAAADQVKSVEVLLQAGASPFALSLSGHAPIDIARWQRNTRVLEVLTAHLRVQSGWLYVTRRRENRHAAGLHRWHKRFCVALAGNAEATQIELAIYKDEASARPQGLAFLTVGDHMLLPPTKTSWRDRPNMFTPDRPIVVRNPGKARKFSRECEDSEQISCGAAEMVSLQFAAASPEERHAWMGLLQGAHLTSVPVGTRFPDPGVYPLLTNSSSASSEFSTPMSMPPPTVHSPPSLLFPSASFDPQASALTAEVASASASASASAPPMVSALETAIPKKEVEVIQPSAPSLEGSFADDDDDIDIDALTVSQRDQAQRQECIVCMDAPRDAICVPCGHVAGCLACLTRLAREHHPCPICRAHVDTVVKVYQC